MTAAIDLGPAVLAPLGAADARVLGAAIAAIDPWARMGYPADALAAYLARHDPGARKFAIVRAGAFAGAAAIRDPWLKGPYLEFLALLPGHQRLGVGARVLAWMAETAPPDARNLWVAASSFNTRAIAFYERHGFSPVAELPGLVADGFTEVLLRRFPVR